MLGGQNGLLPFSGKLISYTRYTKFYIDFLISDLYNGFVNTCFRAFGKETFNITYCCYFFLLLWDTHALTIFFFSLDRIKNKGVLSYLTLIKHEGGHVKSFTYVYMIKATFKCQILSPIIPIWWNLAILQSTWETYRFRIYTIY